MMTKPRRKRPPATTEPVVDPRKILEAIASDPSSPVYVRVQAARALLVHAQSKAAAEKPDENDRVTALAIELLKRKK